MEESSLTFSSGTGVPVGVDILWLCMAKVIFFSLSGRYMPKLLKIVSTFKFHPLRAKIITPTGTPVPDEKVKELSSIDRWSLRSISLYSHPCPFLSYEWMLGEPTKNGRYLVGRAGPEDATLSRDDAPQNLPFLSYAFSKRINQKISPYARFLCTFW